MTELTKEEQQRKLGQLYALMQNLTSSASPIGDWKIAKLQEYLAAGLATPYEIADLYAQRQAVRDEINKLKAELGLSATDDSLTAEEKARNTAKAERAEAVSKLVVTVNGKKFDADETSQNRMARVVAGAQALGVDLETTTQIWVLADNTVAQPTVAELAQALKLAGEAMTSAWTKPYTEE